MNYKFQYKLSGLDCPNCAKKIENALNKNENIIKAIVNFSKLTVSIEANNKEGIFELVSKIVSSIEPNVKVLDLNSKVTNKIKFDVFRLILGIILFVLSMFIHDSVISETLIILAYVILLYKVFKNAIKKLISGFIIDENLLITISCIGAYLTENVHEGLMVIILYEIGKILESIAVNNSRKSISELMDIKPEYANLKVKTNLIKVNPNEIKIGDIIVVKKGEKVPLDGIIIDGESKLDNKALTGESNLVIVKKNDQVLSGSINIEGLLTIKVTKAYEDSTVSQILSLVENATDKKAKTENFVSKAARIYTPVILILAILIGLLLPILPNITFEESIYRALVFLVVSCPCAIAISVPLAYFSGIGASSKWGILIKGSDFLEASSSIKEIIFDKTGTITNDSIESYNLDILDERYTKEEIIKYYLSGEELSNHPIAKNIVSLFKTSKKYKVTEFEEVTGKGIIFKANRKKAKIGSSKFCNIEKQDNSVYLKLDDVLVARLTINDSIKKEAKETIDKLKKLGINIKMFTGDNKDIALNIAEKVGINDVSYELLPKDKFELLESEIKRYNGNVAFVGDGINDAPALRIAKVGISMGSIGSAAAIEASDIVIMNDNLDSLLTLIKVSKKTNRIIKQNLIFAIGIKILVLLLSTFGLISMWLAVFADTGVTLLTILNTTRILKK